MPDFKILVEASARHIHLTEDAVSTLFGQGVQLQNQRALSQPGQFVAAGKLQLKGPRGTIDRVSIIVPSRSEVQVEISLTDARALGVAAPLRESGHVENSAPITLVGPAGSLALPHGCIIAKRHLHVTPEDAELYHLVCGQLLSVQLSGERGLVFRQVVCRINGISSSVMHIDHDEANAVQLQGPTYGTVILPAS